MSISKLFHPGSSGQIVKTPDFYLFVHFVVILKPMVEKKSSGQPSLEQMKSTLLRNRDLYRKK
jgi:hypothetical protein